MQNIKLFIGLYCSIFLFHELGEIIEIRVKNSTQLIVHSVIFIDAGG